MYSRILRLAAILVAFGAMPVLAASAEAAVPPPCALWCLIESEIHCLPDHMDDPLYCAVWAYGCDVSCRLSS